MSKQYPFFPRTVIEAELGPITHENWLNYCHENDYIADEKPWPEHELTAAELALSQTLRPSQIADGQPQENPDQSSMGEDNEDINDAVSVANEDDEREGQAYCNALNFYSGLDEAEWQALINSQPKPLSKPTPEGDQDLRRFIAEMHSLAWTIGQQQAPSLPLKQRPPALLPDQDFATLDEWFEHFNQILTVVFQGRDTIVAHQIWDAASGRIDTQFVLLRGMKEFFANKTIGNVNVFTHWFKHPQRRSATKIEFAPGQTLSPTVFNLWQGYAYSPSYLGSWSLLKYHILHVIAGGDQLIYEFIMDWLADLVQLRGKPGSCLVLVGGKGIGKGVLAKSVAKLMAPYYIHLTRGDLLTGRFNAHLKDLLLIFADEAFWTGDKQAESVLKGLITEDTIAIESKGIDVFQVSNHARIIISTNHSWAVPASDDERRYLVSQVSDRYSNDEPYFDALHNQLENGGYSAMMYELLQRKPQANLRNPPRTRALAQQIYQTDPVLPFLIHVLNTGSLYSSNGSAQPWGDGVVLSEVLYEAFKSFAHSKGKAHTAMDNTTFGKTLYRWLNARKKKAGLEDCIKHGQTRKLTDKVGNKGRFPCYRLSSIEACKAMIDHNLGIPWDWQEACADDDEDDDSFDDYFLLLE